MVTTANGEVQTFEEAQVYVHDLGLLVTVQLLDDTPAVLSLGKLCEDHGYSHERVSGQKPRLTKEGKTITCNIDNNVPLVVSGLSANSGSSTSSTSPLRDQSSTDQTEEQREVTAFGNGSGQSTKTPKKKKNKEHKSNADDRLRDLPEWLEPFTDNLEDTETPAPAPVSQDSDSERTTKVAENLRKHSIFAHFPEKPRLRRLLENQNNKGSCRRRTGEGPPRAEKFGDLITSDHNVLNEECESRNNHRYAVVVQDLATQWIQSYPCKTKTSHKRQRSLRKFLEPDRKPKVIYTDNSLEFGKSCEEFSWTHRTSTPHRSKTNGIAERAVRRVKEGTSPVLLQSGLDERWWSDPVECFCYLRNVQDLLPEMKTPYEKRFGVPFKGPIIPFGALADHHPNSTRDQMRIRQFGKKVLPGIFLGYALIAEGLWKGDFLRADMEELENMDASEIYPRRMNAKEVLIRQKEDEFIFPFADGTAKLSGRDYEFRELTRRREQVVRRENLRGEFQGEREESQPTESRDDIEARTDFWSIQGDFIYRQHSQPRVQLHVPKEETFTH